MIFDKRHAGYSLIEVLVAMVILSLSLTVLLRIFSGGLRNISVSEDYARAILIAEAQLESAGATSYLAPGSSEGVADQNFRWTRTIEAYHPYPADDSFEIPLDAYTVTIDVDWPHAERTRSVSLSGIKIAESGRGKR